MSASVYQTVIRSEELLENLNRDDWIVIDCGFSLADPCFGKNQYKKSHIPGALYAHLDDDLSSQVLTTTGRHPLPDVDAFVECLRNWGIKSDSQVIVYDNSEGSISSRLWWMLRWLGHEQVAVLNGGMSHWLGQGYPLDDQIPTVDSSDIVPCINDEMWVDTHALSILLQSDHCILLDARSHERFKGLIEPIDKIAGHIAGAVNAPYEENLDNAGCYLDASILRDRFLTLLGDYRGQDVVHMCGSGVTACHNMLAMEIAGLTGSRLYPGSWSEWISDRSRPVVSETVGQ